MHTLFLSFLQAVPEEYMRAALFAEVLEGLRAEQKVRWCCIVCGLRCSRSALTEPAVRPT